MPTRLQIPRIGVDAAVEQVELTPEGNMDVPKKWEDVAWYSPGVRPGSAGNAVIDGHLDSYTGPAVFARLRELKPGDDVAVVTGSGQELHFTITEVSAVDAAAAPTARIFGPETTPHLNLITCDGTWNPKLRQYNQRLVVYATLAGS